MQDEESAMRQLLRALRPEQGEKQVFIVSGAPGSGKTTYVSQKKRKGDLVLDMDLLTAALQGENSAHPDYKSVFDATLAAREAVYNVIEARKGEWGQAFVVTTNPKEREVQELAERLGGEIVRMRTDKGECIRRIEDDTTRGNPAKDKDLVAKWFNQN